MTLLNRLLSIVVVSSWLITAAFSSKKWILGAFGASCDTACSTYNSGSVCSPDAIGSTYGWPATLTDFQNLLAITYTSDGSSLITLSCTPQLDTTQHAHNPTTNGGSCFYSYNSPITNCTASASGFHRFCPCSNVFAISPSTVPSFAPTFYLIIPYFSATLTNSATVNTQSYTFTSCIAGTFYFADCDPGRCSNGGNDQYIRLIINGVEVASNDDSCNTCSTIRYTTLSNACQIYTFQMGCYQQKSCTGIFKITITPSTVQSTTPTAMPSVYPSMAPTIFTSFSSVGSHTWVVPSGVTTVQVTLRGASGGGYGCTSYGQSANGGFGGMVSATLIVTPGAKISINVGGQGGTDTGIGGFNGGGK
eukprot:gene32354-43222_t